MDALPDYNLLDLGTQPAGRSAPGLARRAEVEQVRSAGATRDERISVARAD
jgi:hypothetical protein